VSGPAHRHSENLFTDTVKIDASAIVRNAHHPEAAPDQFFRSGNVVETALMLLTVHLDDQPRIHADKISNEPSNRMLTSELQTAEFAITQFPPKRLLRVDRLRPHVAGGRTEERCDLLMRHGSRIVDRAAVRCTPHPPSG
jgi:hypothetical protein